jgi:hypothetical protein
MRAINELYDGDAGLYATFAEDRDFAQQAEIIWNAAGLGEERGIRVLELFAGPAWHAHEFRQRFGSFVECVDSSIAMRALAISAGRASEEQYHLSSLPEMPITLEGRRFGCVVALRYSVGYLEPKGLMKLLMWLPTVMAHGASLFIELHDLVAARDNFRHHSFKDRTVTIPGGTVRCIWPDGPLIWHEDDWKVTMPVRIDMPNGTHRYASTERLYSVVELQDYAAAVGLWEWAGELRSQAFTPSRVIQLRRL